MYVTLYVVHIGNKGVWFVSKIVSHMRDVDNRFYIGI